MPEATITTELDMRNHWDGVYASRSAEQVSWFQSRPSTSLRLIARAAAPAAGVAVVDIGAGASTLAGALLDAGYDDVTLLDISAEALDAVVRQLADRAGEVTRVEADLLTWEPGRAFDVWHDRAVFHFLRSTADIATYVDLASRALRPGGALVLGTFAEDGPTSCSGLSTTRYSSEQLAAVFAPAFALEHTEREQHQTPQGTTQLFTWVLLRRRLVLG